MEKLAMFALFVLMLSVPTIARLAAEGNTIAMVTNNGGENEEHKNRQDYSKNEHIIIIMEEEEPYNNIEGKLKCAQKLEDCFRTPCCSGLFCDIGIHARCV